MCARAVRDDDPVVLPVLKALVVRAIATLMMVVLKAQRDCDTWILPALLPAGARERPCPRFLEGGVRCSSCATDPQGLR